MGMARVQYRDESFDSQLFRKPDRVFEGLRSAMARRLLVSLAIGANMKRKRHLFEDRGNG